MPNKLVSSRRDMDVISQSSGVPTRFAGRRLTVRLTATTVEAFDGGRLVSRHERAVGRHTEVLALDHYLEVLKSKPGALPGATALAQARSSGAFSAAHQRYWEAARRVRGDAAGTRALIEVLLAHRTLPRSALEVAMRTAIETGLLDPQVVIIDARRHATGEPSKPPFRSERGAAMTGPPPRWPPMTNC